MTVKAEIEFVGVLRDLAETRKTSLELDGGNGDAVVRDFVAELGNSMPPRLKEVLIDPESNDLRPNLLVLLNGVEIGCLEGLDTKVEDADRIVLIPVSHGG
ncbi:MAG: ubiquitin-related modifier 1 [Candidatus Bathyarchaeota archaeon]|nr:ubiquitin-related modifier 1 [Candidatus Bathyarchaeota archaeon]